MRIELCAPLRLPGALTAAMGVSGAPAAFVGGIATDSREVRPGDLFIALRGERADGASFLGEAIRRGAVGVMGEGLPALPYEVPLALRLDPIAALLRAATAYRRMSMAFVVAVSGSTGKTTAKEAIATVLAQKGSTCKSEGNYNSTLGLPLSILSFAEADFWVVELGVSHVGEMGQMAAAAAPDLAVLTNVGTAHVGHFGGFDALLHEKAQIASALSDRGLLLAPFDLPVSAFPCGCGRVRSMGQDRRADFYLENICMSEKGVSGDLITPYRVITNLDWSIPGRVGASTLTTVGAAAVMAGCADEQIRRGLSEAGCGTPRLSAALSGKRLLIDDCYNASPEAVVGALEVLIYRAAGRPTVAVLGDMLELGERGDALHRAIGASLARLGVSMLFTYGEKALAFAEGARMGGMTDDAVFTFDVGDEKALAKAVLRVTPENAAILFKGSGKMKMSRILAAVRSEA